MSRTTEVKSIYRLCIVAIIVYVFFTVVFYLQSCLLDAGMCLLFVLLFSMGSVFCQKLGKEYVERGNR